MCVCVLLPQGRIIPIQSVVQQHYERTSGGVAAHQHVASVWVTVHHAVPKDLVSEGTVKSPCHLDSVDAHRPVTHTTRRQ